jgi:hypothetical protein
MASLNKKQWQHNYITTAVISNTQLENLRTFFLHAICCNRDSVNTVYMWLSLANVFIN